MEGPTPVSALIHAATMVTAGVYMVARMNPLFTLSGVAAHVVALVGAVTAVFAATMALTQNDIKRVLAYSTISQIGYMFIGCGVGAYAAGMFHLTTHAFFKSLLFLSAGSVMHALSGELDMRKMGGLRKYLPVTYPVFLVGAIAIAGVPFLSGFFSKDAILTHAFAEGQYFIWALGVMGAVLTAFYMFRLIFLTFFGEERLDQHAKAHLHESPPVMTVPLIILAFFSVVAGYAGLPLVFGEKANLFSRFLEPVIHAGHEGGLGIEHRMAPDPDLGRGLPLRDLSSPISSISGPRGSPTGWWPASRPSISSSTENITSTRSTTPSSSTRCSGPPMRSIGISTSRSSTGRSTARPGRPGSPAGPSPISRPGEVKDYALAILLGVVIFLGFLVFG